VVLEIHRQQLRDSIAGGLEVVRREGTRQETKKMTRGEADITYLSWVQRIVKYELL
jgi:hypothetical protein